MVVEKFWVLFEDVKDEYRDYYFFGGAYLHKDNFSIYVDTLSRRNEVFGMSVSKSKAVELSKHKLGKMEIEDVICFNYLEIDDYLKKFSKKVISKDGEEVVFIGDSRDDRFGKGIFRFICVEV